MRRNIGVSLLSATLGLGGFGLLALHRDIIYGFNSDGTYAGKVNYDGAGADGSRWACIIGSGDCMLCGNCHTSAETASPSYVAKYDAVKHRKTHFPSLTVTLASGQKLGFGTGAHLRLSNKEIALTSNAGKDRALFPAGSIILYNRVKEPQLIALPPMAEPKILPE